MKIRAIEERCLKEARTSGVLCDAGDVDDTEAAIIITFIAKAVLRNHENDKR